MSFTLEQIAEGLPEAPEPARRPRAQGDRVLGGPVDAAAVKAAQRYLERRAPAVEGERGDEHTLVTAMGVLEYVPDPDTALILMAPWNERCVPPWDEDELLAKIEGASRSMATEPGRKAAHERAKEDALAEFATYGDSLPQDGSQFAKSGESALYHPTQAKLIFAAQEFEDFDDDQDRTDTKAGAHLGLWRAGTRQNVVGAR